MWGLHQMHLIYTFDGLCLSDGGKTTKIWKKVDASSTEIWMGGIWIDYPLGVED